MDPRGHIVYNPYWRARAGDALEWLGLPVYSECAERRHATQLLCQKPLHQTVR